MLDYLYLGKYRQISTLFSHLLSHAEAYIVGDRYDIPHLRVISQAAFITSLKCYDIGQKTALFLDTIRLVYSKTTSAAESLRSAIVYAIRGHRDLLKTDAMQELLCSFSDLAHGLALSIARINRPPRVFEDWRVVCEHCKRDLERELFFPLFEPEPLESSCITPKGQEVQLCQWVILAKDENT